jgi:polysaccharide pyruvyl transferase WcaK-like protein
LAAPNLHDVLCADVDLREIVAQYSEPSVELSNYVTWVLPAHRRSVEIGISSLSIPMAKRASTHLVVTPTRKAADSLAALLSKNGLGAETLTIRPAEGAAALPDLEDGGADTVVLSCAPAFPGYFAWCHEALRWLRVGGRLIVRGTGVWTVEQFKNHLRIDPRFVGWTLIAPDAVLVSKQSETQDVPWSAQPYVLVNSAVQDEASLRRARALPLRARVESFSAEATQAARLKTGGPVVGLIGYYGYGNYGDELFRNAFEFGLPDVRIKMFTDMPRRPFVIGDRGARVDQVDALLIGGGDLLSPGYWPDPYFDEAYLKKPVFIHGVGVPRWTGGDPKVIARLRAFLQHPNVRHINVRDVESQNWILSQLQPACPVEVSADMVFGLDFEARPAPARSKPVLTLIPRKTGGADDASFEGLRQLARAAKAAGFHVRLVIAGAGSTGEDDLDDALSRRLEGDEIVKVSLMEEITAAIVDSDIVASMKFHGCVVGLMAGKPTFGLIQTDKFTNLYRALGIENMALSLQHPDVGRLLDLPRLAVDAARLGALRESARAGMAQLNRKIVARL